MFETIEKAELYLKMKESSIATIQEEIQKLQRLLEQQVHFIALV
jgi:hypothetical protein